MGVCTSIVQIVILELYLVAEMHMGISAPYTGARGLLLEFRYNSSSLH